MRALLCDIPLPSENKFGPFKRLGSAFPPLNLLYLGTAARKNGHEVRITTDRETPEEVADAIREFQPDLIGITFMTLGVPYLGALLEMIERLAPRAVIVTGGYHSSLFPEQILREHPRVRAVFKGEAERTFPLFADAVADGSPDDGCLEQIPGIYFRRRDGSIASTEPGPFIEDLDEVPFPEFDLIPGFFDRFHPALNRHFLGTPHAFLLTGRGCSFDCRFCGRQMLGRKVRQNSVEYRVDLIRWCREKYGIRSIVFGDEFLTIDKARTVEFCDALQRAGLARIKWCCSGRANNMDLEFARRLRAAGCVQIGYGCETGSQEILDILNKRITIERMEQAIRDAHRAGLQIFGNFMLGCPGETPETLEMTYRFIMRNPLDYVVLCNFTPLPGSFFWDEQRYLQYGVLQTDDLTQFNLFAGMPFVPHGCTAEQIRNARNRIYRDFYLRPGRILKEWKNLFNPNSWRFLGRAIGLLN